MEKPIASLEIGSSRIKIVIGYVQESRIDVLYAQQKEVPPGLIEGGYILNIEALANLITDLKTVYFDATKSRINLEDIVLVLPSIGVEVYQNNKVTNVISEIGKIERIDISNAYSLVRKDRVSANSEIIDIIPDYFTLEDRKTYDVAPIGLISNTITINAKVHTLPSKIINAYRRIMSAANFKVMRNVVNAYAASCYINTLENHPNRYFLIDMGAETTTISLISDGILYASNHIENGGKTLSKKIATHFNLSFEEADKIKKMYGVDRGHEDINIPIFRSTDPNTSAQKDYFSRDLNEVIIAYLDEVHDQIARAIRTISEEQAVNPHEQIPMLYIGGASNLTGLSQYLRTKHEVPTQIVHSRVIGARDTSYINALGALMALSKNHDEVVEEQIKITSLTRVDIKN